MAGSRLWTGEDKSRILSCAARERHGREAATTRAERHDPGRFALGAPKCETGAKRRRNGVSRDDERQDKAGQSMSAMDGAGGTGSGAGRGARRIADVPNALKVQVWRRLRPPAEHSGSGEASSAGLAPKANLEVAEAHEDAEVARINREARLPLSAPSLEPEEPEREGRMKNDE